MQVSGRGKPTGRGQAPIHFKEETISLCHPERSAGSRAGRRSCAALRMTLLPLRMTILNRLRLTRTSSSLKCIALCAPPGRGDASGLSINLPLRGT